MKRRIHSSLQTRQRHYDFTDFLKVKRKMTESSSTANSGEDSMNSKKQLRSQSVTPSSFHISANFLEMIGYSPQRVAPVVRVKATTFISSKPLKVEASQKFQKIAISKFSKFDTYAGKLCRSCEEQYRYKPKLFKRRK